MIPLSVLDVRVFTYAKNKRPGPSKSGRGASGGNVDVHSINRRRRYFNTCACNECPHMRRNTLEKLYLCMQYEQPEIVLPERVIMEGKACIDRMLAISAQAGL